jgi:hypothetical protein
VLLTAHPRDLDRAARAVFVQGSELTLPWHYNYAIRARTSHSPGERTLRKNLPVTTTEYHLTDKTLIVSKTDLKGKLAYFNDSFVEASGYER